MNFTWRGLGSREWTAGSTESPQRELEERVGEEGEVNRRGRRADGKVGEPQAARRAGMCLRTGLVQGRGAGSWVQPCLRVPGRSELGLGSEQIANGKQG